MVVSETDATPLYQELGAQRGDTDATGREGGRWIIHFSSSNRRGAWIRANDAPTFHSHSSIHNPTFPPPPPRRGRTDLNRTTTTAAATAARSSERRRRRRTNNRGVTTANRIRNTAAAPPPPPRCLLLLLSLISQTLCMSLKAKATLVHFYHTFTHPILPKTLTKGFNHY